MLTRLNIFVPAGVVCWLLAGLHCQIANGQAGELTANSHESERQSAEVDFNEDIRPLLNEHCTACHGGVKQAGDLSFVYRDSVLNIVEAGDAENSYLIERVISKDDDERMPPPEHGRALNDSEIALLRTWIDAGAEWGTHWAYVLPRRHSPKATAQRDWSQKPIDRFILSQLETAGLEPNPEATPARWLRRASLDITGLPPTPESIAAFESALADGEQNRLENGNAEGSADRLFEAEVDRLLNEAAYGEKWASPWLDAVRYADSRGLGLDGRRSIWKYRDWVINALNQDMPFDQFTVKQLAGDLLPDPSLDDLVATACHRLTQTNEEGGTDDEQFRVEAVIDRVNTTWQVWQGVSFGCVQCHAHPYDPVQHDEYYEFLAYFNNTIDSDLSDDAPTISVPIDSRDYDRVRALSKEMHSLQQELFDTASRIASDDSWTAWSGMKASTNNTTQVVVSNVDGFEEVQTQGTVAKSTTVVIESEIAEASVVSALKVTGLPRDIETALRDSEWGYVISAIKLELIGQAGTAMEMKFARVASDEAFPVLNPADSLNPKSTNGVGPYSRMHHPRSAYFVLSAPMELLAGQRLRLSLSQNIFALGAFPLVAPRLRIAHSENAAWQSWANGPAWGNIDEINKAIRKVPSVRTPVMQRRPEGYLRPTGVFGRGNYLTKEQIVRPGTPEFLPGEPGNSRLDMAMWIASQRNPLTSRVHVNRVWGAIFGTGIVATQEDFGSTGEAPSHPRLLDDLAVRFQTEMGWSQKALIREIVLSATYRQSSISSAKQLQIDPQNRLLSHGPRRRLTAEEVRDQALAISNLLHREQFGSPVYPPIPKGVWNPFQAGDKWKTAKKGDSNRYRRTIYTYTKRSIQFPIMASFDAPSREACSMRRLPSNTPLQALMTLNDEAFVECAESFAKLMSQAAKTPGDQISFGYRRATGQQPTQEQHAMLLKLYQNRAEELGESEASGQAGESDEAAAVRLLQPIAMILLNLDEVLNN